MYDQCLLGVRTTHSAGPSNGSVTTTFFDTDSGTRSIFGRWALHVSSTVEDEGNVDIIGDLPPFPLSPASCICDTSPAGTCAFTEPNTARANMFTTLCELCGLPCREYTVLVVAMLVICCLLTVWLNFAKLRPRTRYFFLARSVRRGDVWFVFLCVCGVRLGSS